MITNTFREVFKSLAKKRNAEALALQVEAAKKAAYIWYYRCTTVIAVLKVLNLLIQIQINFL